MSYYFHNTPGRLRIKSPVIKNSRNAAEGLKNLLSVLSGITSVDINPTTGSLLVKYDHETLNYKYIVGILQRKGYFDISKAATNDQYIQNAVSKTFSIVSKVVLGSFTEMAIEGFIPVFIGD
jgi:archaellin